MPENQQKKQPRKRGKNINVSIQKHWKDLLKEIDMKDVNVELLDRIIICMVDGTELSIDVKQLLETGVDPEEIEEKLRDKFEDLDEYISDVRFFVNIDKVIDTVQSETDKVFKDI